jgi:hypothetical protein
MGRSLLITHDKPRQCNQINLSRPHARHILCELLSGAGGQPAESVTDSLSLGTVKSRTVTTTSENSLTNFSTVVVPELSP